jgi:hypothetical protein
MFFFPESQWLIDRRQLPRKSSDPSQAAETVNKFPSSQVFCAFAAKGGRNDESHNHNDLGHFILHCDGDTLFADLGAPEYTKKYFGPDRYSILHASSKGHSVPFINGREQAPGSEYYANVLDCREINGAVWFRLDLTKAYGLNGLKCYHRTFKWDYNKLKLNITDEFSFNQPANSIQEVFITMLEPVLASPGKLLIKGKNCTSTLTYDAGMKTDIIKEEFIDHHGKPSLAYRICLGCDMTGLKSQIIVTISVEAYNPLEGVIPITESCFQETLLRRFPCRNSFLF